MNIYDPLLKEIASGIKDHQHAYRVRLRLNSMIKLLKKENQWVLNRSLYHIKLAAKNSEEAAVELHPLSDHAFLRYLERFAKVDIVAMKNKVMVQLEERDDIEIIRNNCHKIVTVVPKEWKHCYQRAS